jgi:hypothetical protein
MRRAFSRINDLYQPPVCLVEKMCAGRKQEKERAEPSQLDELYQLNDELSKQINLLWLRSH